MDQNEREKSVSYMPLFLALIMLGGIVTVVHLVYMRLKVGHWNF